MFYVILSFSPIRFYVSNMCSMFRIWNRWQKIDRTRQEFLNPESSPIHIHGSAMEIFEKSEIRSAAFSFIFFICKFYGILFWKSKTLIFTKLYLRFYEVFEWSWWLVFLEEMFCHFVKKLYKFNFIPPLHFIQFLH